MKDVTIDRIFNKLERAYLIAQVVFSWCVIIFGYSYALRALFTDYDRFFDKCFYAVCFIAIGVVGQKMFLRASLQELREARKADKQ